MVLVGLHDRSVCQDNLKRRGRGACPAVTRPKVGQATAQGQPSHADARHSTSGDTEPQGVKPGIDGIPRRPYADGYGRAVPRVHVDGVEPRQVDGHAPGLVGRPREPHVPPGPDGKSARAVLAILIGGKGPNDRRYIGGRLRCDETQRVDRLGLQGKVRRQSHIIRAASWERHPVRPQRSNQCLALRAGLC